MPACAAASPVSTADIQAAAIEISRLLRDAKVDPPLRAKVLAAIVVAHAAGPLDGEQRGVLATINRQVVTVLAGQRALAQALRLGGPDFQRLVPFVAPIAAVLERIHTRALLTGNHDFLGVFYEAFLRYGYDNNALGIVFTPRHITRFCVNLIGVSAADRVIDVACGTGGFLVAADDAMRRYKAANAGCDRDHALCRDRSESRGTLAGFDTNPTVWALATLNMRFRGAASAIRLGNCFDAQHRREVRGRFTRAFLNPPFSQDAEPERDFIDQSMDALVPGGRCAVVVKAGIFADEEHARWRAQFLRRHTVLGVISLPEDVFYPTAAPTSILVAEAHVPQQAAAPVLMGRVWNDGFEKLKNRRVECAGDELPEVQRCFAAMMAGDVFDSPLAVAVEGERLKDGAEWSPQQWLPHYGTDAEIARAQEQVAGAIFRAVAQMPELADNVLTGFGDAWQELPALPLGTNGKLSDFFRVVNGRSAGEKHFGEGALPYVSSGGSANSIVRLVSGGEHSEVFADGGITVTAFGQASVQPWPFLARGNGGSSVRVLLPRYRMGFKELVWFAAQVNAQQWRFFYARMAIKSRIERLMVSSPPAPLPAPAAGIAEKVGIWRETLTRLSEI